MKYFVVLFVLLVSCGPQKRYQRLVTKYPWLVETDTVIIRDTIIKEKRVVVPEYRDSFIIEHDTIIETEKLIIQKFKDRFKVIVKQDTLMVKDTAFVEVKVPGKIVHTKEVNWIYILLSFILGTISVLLISRKI